ncbi:zinc finger protein DZIP1L [Asbolus verrucosus]|uniref:Zinc finger protein DZIP1L n=1 Tax=Asbolus verrucosus TaxID=1661398 RepID=A0A482VJE6_ASBVE|nr:zinc finger protein DZIP1L [Asbolus verrucosus]
MFGENYKWNYDYARLARDSLIDIDRVIQEKDVATIEKFIPCVVQFILDPEQAQILDDNFVKIFRMSQLAIDYLLFCKRYLDKTLVNVKEDFSKLSEENKELNLFVEDLKEHISLLMKEIKEKVSSFRCEHCNKVFSSEEFLNSHIKRRHSTSSNQLIEVETDKLHLEIKELKGRLNSAEKMIQNDQIHHKPVQEKEIEYESKKIDELQQKFEDLRVQVQSELKILQTQHNFQEKYEKLFEKMTLQNSRVQLDRGAGDLGKRRESTTQTDTEISQEPSIHFEVPKLEQKNKENLPDFDNTRKQISEFGEALEIKVTSSLQNIETQMQSFWNKLNEMEVHRKNYDESQMPPTIKPSSSKKIVVDDELFQHFKEEVEKIIIMGRLQDLGVVASPQIEIKNRKMYDTDSENEIVAVGKANESLKQFSLPYSAVIEELKSVTTKLEASDKSVSELNSVKDEEIAKNEDQTKGVLKNYPSVGSLTKKKVLFNLNNEDNLQLLNRDGGSTTSITSSVFDGTPRKKKENKIDKEKDIEDLSDFDFSDM